MILGLPEQVRQKNQDAQGNAVPKPFTLEESTRVSKDHCSGDANREESHGVLRLHAEADRGADGQPPARVFGGEQLDRKVRRGNPAQIIERNVLHQRATANAKRKRGERSDQLRGPAAAKLAGHQSGKNNRNGLRDSGEKAKSGQRSSEEYQRQAPEKRRNRRISNEAPVKMACIF